MPSKLNSKSEATGIPTGHSYRTFSCGQTDKQFGFRIGGAAPAHVVPGERNRLTRYLMTVPLSADLELSAFPSFDFESDGETNPFDAAYTMHDEANPLVQVVFHEYSKRDVSHVVPSDIPGRRLVLTDEVAKDSTIDEPYPFHKLGGIPSFTREFDSEISKQSLELMDEGYLHVLQLSFPAGPRDDVIDCDWPFGDAVFHLFIKLGNGACTYKYCWA